jgi:hypothetical protein
MVAAVNHNSTSYAVKFYCNMFRRMYKEAVKVPNKRCYLEHFNYFALFLYAVRISTYNIIKT